MITNDYTRFIVRKLAEQAAVEAAAQAIVDEENRRVAAQASYTVAELLELVDLALAEDDRYQAAHFAWLVVDRDRRYVSLSGWNFRRPLMLRPASVPAEVTHITGCTCDGGVCSYCTCCELWNGEHSCEWI